MRHYKLTFYTAILLFLALGSNNAFCQDKAPPSSATEYEKRFQENLAKDRINGVYIPKNLDDAFVQLDKLLDPRSREKFKSMSEETAASKLHFSLGRWMITNWQFYEGSRFSNYLASAGITYPDDKADFMIRSYHRHVNGQSIGFKELAIAYKAMRKAQYEKELTEAKVIKVLPSKKKER
jgi:hypothetical protein